MSQILKNKQQDERKRAIANQVKDKNNQGSKGLIQD